MSHSAQPIVPLRLTRFLHGGDYNPDQWQHMPEIIDEDFRLMELAHCNTFSIDIFGWAALEPEEGKFTFGWLDRVLDHFGAKGWKAIVATPSAAMPAWLSQRYPETLRVGANRQRYLHGNRVSFCLTSPLYREKVRIINEQLAQRYKDHPALMLWHISNEYGGNDNNGACHCELCQEAFRNWLRAKFNNDLDALNHAWWTGFWAHPYTDWSQIASPSPIGEGSLHGLWLDWLRFVTHQTIDFYRNEIEPLRRLTPNTPITTNFMGLFHGLDYWKFAKEVDVACWDNYPMWHAVGDHGERYNPFLEAYNWHADSADWKLASDIAFVHDINRCLKDGQPFLLMESTPSNTNWQLVGKLKRPGMHALSSLQAVAHGSDAVLYFQWRKGRGGFEKFHGAVVDHSGHEKTRVFRDVAALGETLEKMDEMLDSRARAEVAIICDWENRWAIDNASGPRVHGRNYVPACQAHYRPFWERGVSVDILDEDKDFSGYKLLIAPMMYMVRPGVAERIAEFVKNGGVFVTTYWSGITDENDLCFMGGFPGPLRPVLGVWNEELDSLHDPERRKLAINADCPLPLGGEYEANTFCALIHAEGARVLATYAEDFYAGMPALTVNQFGKGQAYYIASRNSQAFTNDFCAGLIAQLGLKRALETTLPEGVTAQARYKDGKAFIFVMNFTPAAQSVALPPQPLTDLITKQPLSGALPLEPYGVRILKANA